MINEDYVAGKARLWATLGSQSLHAIFSTARGLFERQDLEIDLDSSGVLWDLSLSCHLTSESLLVLVREKRLWDSDMLMRSVMEGSVRLFYMATPNEKSRHPRVHEYNSILPEVDTLRWHERAQRFLGAMPNPEEDALRPIRELLLPEDRVAQIRAKFPKATRRALANRWSFNELMRSLAEEDPKRYTTLGPLGHGYNVSSQLLHQSADGIGMIRDRIKRSDERRLAIELAHAARLVSDILDIAKVRAAAIKRLFGENLEDLVRLDVPEKPLRDELEAAQQHFHSVEYRKAA